MYPRVTGVISKQDNDQSDLMNRMADTYNLPPLLLVACAIAESNLDEHAERYGTWPDVSFGEFQQTVAFAPIGDHTGSISNISIVRSGLFDVVQAIEIAAPQLGRWWAQDGDPINALCRYNWPGGDPATNPNRANYERGWNAAQLYLAPDEEPPAMTDYALARWAPSPNYASGREGSRVTAIVLHGTAGGGAVAWFQQPISAVSAHYVVEQDGTVTQCVREADQAWANGVVTPDSEFYGGKNPNLWTISIEHTRDRTNTSPITPAQLDASLVLVRDIMARYGPLALLTHDEIDVGRVCPGPGFPLAAFTALLDGGDELSAEDRATLAWWQGVAPVLPGFLNTVEDQAAALAQRTRGQNHEAAAAILAQLASFRQVSGYQREAAEA
jgi:N-acetyl-anhydromuramyl-L-alanine amidase AmpD